MLFRICTIFISVGAMIFAQETFDPTIPVVDMRDFYDIEKRENFLETVREALHEVGFFAVTNTGINQGLIQDTFNTAKEYFALDLDTKMKIDGKESNYQRGYAPVGKEAAKGSNIADLKEFLHIGREMSDADLERLKIWKNIWPEDMDIKTAMLTYLEHLDRYVIELGHIFALALGAEEDFFDEMLRDGDCLLRVIHYPPSKSNQEVTWAKAHTDIDLFTILPKATAKGLEVQLSDGSWVPIVVNDDSFVINAGDFTEIFSNGYYKSAQHRVKHPSGESDYERMSMVYFVHPSSDAILTPLSQCIEKTGDGKKFATATRMEMLMERLADLGQATPDMLKSLGESGVLDRLIEVDRASLEAMKCLRNAGYASEKVLYKLDQLGE